MQQPTEWRCNNKSLVGVVREQRATNSIRMCRGVSFRWIDDCRRSLMLVLLVVKQLTEVFINSVVSRFVHVIWLLIIEYFYYDYWLLIITLHTGQSRIPRGLPGELHCSSLVENCNQFSTRELSSSQILRSHDLNWLPWHHISWLWCSVAFDWRFETSIA